MQQMTASELEAAIRAVRRDGAARDRLLDHYRPYLTLLAEQSLGPAVRRREDASDVVQRTMLEAAQAVASFRGTSEPEFSAWIKQILRRNVANAVRDHHAAKRDVRREQVLEDDDGSAMLSWRIPAAHQTSPSLKVIKAEAALNLVRCLDRLPDDQRRAVVMRHLEGRTLAEIAETLQKTPAAAAGLLRRGVSSLRQRLADESLQ